MEPVGEKHRKARPGKRSEQKDATHQRIYQAARQLFEERGYFETTSGDIAKAAGVSTGSVFAHFGSKAKIMTAVMIEISSRRIERLQSAKWQSRTCLGRLHEIAALLWQLNNEETDLMRACFSYTWVWDKEEENRFNEYIAERGRLIHAILAGADDWDEFCADFDVDFGFRLFQCYHENLVRESAHVPPDELYPRLLRAVDFIFARAAPE